MCKSAQYTINGLIVFLIFAQLTARIILSIIY